MTFCYKTEGKKYQDRGAKQGKRVKERKCDSVICSVTVVAKDMLMLMTAVGIIFTNNKEYYVHCYLHNYCHYHHHVL